jgi:hypothetical protein
MYYKLSIQKEIQMFAVIVQFQRNDKDQYSSVPRIASINKTFDDCLQFRKGFLNKFFESVGEGYKIHTGEGFKHTEVTQNGEFVQSITIQDIEYPLSLANLK